MRSRADLGICSAFVFGQIVLSLHAVCHRLFFQLLHLEKKTEITEVMLDPAMLTLTLAEKRARREGGGN